MFTRRSPIVSGEIDVTTENDWRAAFRFEQSLFETDLDRIGPSIIRTLIPKVVDAQHQESPLC